MFNSLSRVPVSFGSVLTHSIRKELERKIGECGYCGRKTLDEGTFDHLWPKVLGGTNTVKNGVLACNTCNGLKGDMTPDEWFRTYPLAKRYFRRYLKKLKGTFVMKVNYTKEMLTSYFKYTGEKLELTSPNGVSIKKSERIQRNLDISC